MSQHEHEAVTLPAGWWDHLGDLVVPNWPSIESFCEDTPMVSFRTLTRARLRRRLTERTFHLLASKLKLAPGQLLSKFRSSSDRVHQLDTLRIASIADLLQWGWDGNRLLDELIHLDYETIDGLTVEHEGHIEQWAPVFMDHPQTWRLLVHGQEIVGYWHFVPLFEDEFALAEGGHLLDSEVTADKVRLFELPGVYDVYFVSFCVKERHRRMPAVRILFSSFVDVAVELAREGVFFRNVCANAYTGGGVSICRTFGMKWVRQHLAHGQVYVRHFYPLPSHETFSSHPELSNLYAARFGE